MFDLIRNRGIAAAVAAACALLASPAWAADAPPIRTAGVAPLIAAPRTDAVIAIAVPGVAPAIASTGYHASLNDLVISYVDRHDQDAEQQCLAKAVFFEARGETLEGQLAVAQVVLNRAASPLYPSTVCGVVTQPAQFSFIRNGEFPDVDIDSACWHKALAIADVARRKLFGEIDPHVYWYHADYVSPAWNRRLTRIAQIGTHIFYS